MTKPLSLDLRKRVIAAIDGGLSCRAAAKRFGIARSAVVKWRRLWLDTGSIAPRAQGGDTRSGRIEAVEPAILGMVAEAPGLTLVEIAEQLEREHGERFAPSTVHRVLHRRGWSFRRSRACLQAGSRRRRTWALPLVQGMASPCPRVADRVAETRRCIAPRGGCVATRIRGARASLTQPPGPAPFRHGLPASNPPRMPPVV